MTASELESLYDAHAAALLGFLVALTGAEADARDLLQEVFVRLARMETPAAALENPGAFLLTIARRTAADFFRRESSLARRHRTAGMDVPLLAPGADPDASAMNEALEHALGELPPEQRASLVLHVWQGLTLRETAEVLDIPLNTAASRCRYGLSRLRAALQPLYNEIR